LVDKFIAPFPSKVLVKTGVHCASDRVALALCSKTKEPFTGPLVAVIVSVVPLTLMPEPGTG
jgi:hypothetical protein